MQIDYIEVDDETVLWFFDLEYVGHDDQIEVQDWLKPDTYKHIVFTRRTLKDKYSYDDVYEVKSMEELNDYLNPLGRGY